MKFLLLKSIALPTARMRTKHLLIFPQPNITFVLRDIQKFLHITSLCYDRIIIILFGTLYDDYHCCKQIFLLFREKLKENQGVDAEK
jgi:hypothetical protein